MQFDPNTSVYDACRLIREKITEANLGQRKYFVLYKSYVRLHWVLNKIYFKQET